MKYPSNEGHLSFDALRHLDTIQVGIAAALESLHAAATAAALLSYRHTDLTDEACMTCQRAARAIEVARRKAAQAIPADMLEMLELTHPWRVLSAARIGTTTDGK